MAYDEGLAERLRELLADERGLSEKRMFGGIAFLLGGHMCCGVTGADLMLRVGADAEPRALEEPHVRPMDFTGRPLKGFVYVAAPGYESDRDLAAWVARAVRFVRSLPPRPSR